ncbi:MAG: hypothetical protein K2X72_08145 [Reyranella sp.]|nr:hypothetical protein [Reyranella sp.]
MSSLACQTVAVPSTIGAIAPDRLTRRVLDAVLREDVRGCMSRGRIEKGTALSFADQLDPALRSGGWLGAELAGVVLWLPVEPCRFMQEWRLRSLPAIACVDGQAQALTDLASILRHFRAGLDAETRGFHEAFAEECRVAEEHGAWCAAERSRWFADNDGGVANWPTWAASLLRHDRLAAFHDHPFYPTARAKLGFSKADLRAYAPEFQPIFELHWVAAPRALYRGADLPAHIAPRFADVGLPEDLAGDHVLLPVHGAMWTGALDGYLAESGLTERVVRAPLPWLKVTPTLSVRTVAVLGCPSHHIKLPLVMRTLGTRNLRTIKPSTIRDGHGVQTMLKAIAADLPELGHRLLLTDEEVGGCVADQPFLGFILRRYPDTLRDEDVAPVAALAARGPDRRLVIETLADRHRGGDLLRLFEEYLELTARLHLTLWIRYGVALESNQQNSMLALSAGSPLRLLLKDNDAARIDGARLASRRSDLSPWLDGLLDRRIVVDDPMALARMFITITLQLNLAVLVEAMAEAGHATRDDFYRRVREALSAALDDLAADSEDVTLARRALLQAERLPLKYLLRAASLESKASTGAADVNKFYGETAPNFLRAS